MAHSKIHKLALAASLALVAGFSGYCLLISETCHRGTFFLSADQQGQRHYRQGRFDPAARRFADSTWRAAAYYRAGDFKQAAALFSGVDTPQGAFNEGNARVMLGQYAEAVQNYDRALAGIPDWEAAQANRRIALARAERVKKEGGDMTGGKMGADDFTFSKTKGAEPSDPPPEPELGSGDAAMRAQWLRKVQTRPADFLRAKFAFQQAAARGGQAAPEP
jgi:Ca-activated chloride channel family protein